MAAAKALLAGAGLLPARARIATEHAPAPSTEHAPAPSTVPQSIATEHAQAKDEKRRPLTGLPKLTSDVGALDTELGDDALEKIVALLLWMSQDFKSCMTLDDIHYAALDTVIRCSESPNGGALGLLHTGAVANLSKLIDLMMVHKTKSGDHIPKDANITLGFMRRVVSIREQRRLQSVLTGATERVDSATGRAELSEADVAWCYQRLGRDLLTYDLLPHQWTQDRYLLRTGGDSQLTNFQRSFADNMLRKHLGDKKVALVIWQHGLPRVADPPLPRGHGYELNLRMLQSGLDECLKWYVSLANDIFFHRTQEGFEEQQSMSSKDDVHMQRQQTRREALQKARDSLRLGASLQQQRDDKKRSFDDMIESEKQSLEDYETRRTAKVVFQYTTKPLKPFRCNLRR